MGLNNQVQRLYFQIFTTYPDSIDNSRPAIKSQ